MSKLNFLKNKSYLNLLNRMNLISILLTLLVFFLDRVTKIKILNFSSENSKIFLNDYINLDLAWNTGIGFGLFSSYSGLIYNSISLIIGIILVFIVFLICKSNYINKIILSLILGGAIGNFYDRIVYYAVPDFIDIHYNNFHWFTFNVADIFITIGVVILLFRDLVIKKNEDL